MPIPSRLANDGWWLSEPPTVRAASLRQPARTTPMKILSLEPFADPFDLRGTPVKLMAAFGLVALADWLFYDRSIGLSLPLFMLALVAAALMTNPLLVDRRRAITIFALLIAALVPLIDDVSTVSTIFGILSAALAVSALTNPFFDSRFTGLRALLLIGPFRLLPDILRMRPQSEYARLLIAWIVPLLLSGTFLVLFAAANPLFASWLSSIDLTSILAKISIARTLFWLIAASLVWPFMFTRWRRPKSKNTDPADAMPEAGFNRDLFGSAAILRSLVLFNLLFSVQTLSDLAYLWGGVALPDGMTYATYAHRGAFPLIVTALLAAGFILAATNSGEASRSSLIRLLIMIWTGQNVLLVISSMLRLDLYIQTYALTYWRAAAFIWMGLVAIGLVLIVTRIAFGYSNRWLIGANLSALALTMYVCAFINFPAVIATYNVTHSKEISGTGVPLDYFYLISLGPQAIPALDRFNLGVGKGSGSYGSYQRGALAAQVARELSSWRGWSFRGWRLQQYLNHNTGRAS